MLSWGQIAAMWIFMRMDRMRWAGTLMMRLAEGNDRMPQHAIAAWDAMNMCKWIIIWSSTVHRVIESMEFWIGCPKPKLGYSWPFPSLRQTQVSCAGQGICSLLFGRFCFNGMKQSDLMRFAAFAMAYLQLKLGPWEALFQSLHQDVAIVSLPLGFIMLRAWRSYLCILCQ